MQEGEMAENNSDPNGKRKINFDECSENSDSSKRLNADDPTRISLKFVDEKGREFFVRVKRTIKLGKVIDTYCAKHGLVYGHTRFFYCSKRVQRTYTPADMGMEDKDEIDVYTEVDGGGGFSFQLLGYMRCV